MIEQALKSVRALGFLPEKLDDSNFSFDYEGLNLICTAEGAKIKCLTIMIPGIYEITDDNRNDVLEAMAALCDKVMYVQPQITFGNQIWLTYQHYLGDYDVTPELIEHMVGVLAYSAVSFNNIIIGNDEY